ncbi:MAG: hypothetical protein HY602_02890 [Parcubacteria group bacterium]|nr:hypothetical protein [Parcubacteria group bacterium]
MEVLNAYSSVWSIIETLMILAALILFFKDPLRRWVFLGYRPTAILVIYAPDNVGLEKVLVIKKKYDSFWDLSQGGIYSSDIYHAVSDIARRELGLQESDFLLRFSMPLGAQVIKDDYRMKRSTTGTISWRKLRGKGYIACFVLVNEEVISRLHLGYEIGMAQFVSIGSARQMLTEQEGDERTQLKKQFYLRILDELAKIIEMRKKKLELKKTPIAEKEVCVGQEEG